MQRIDMKTGWMLQGAMAVAMVAVALLSGCADKPDALIASAKEHLARNDRNAAVIQLKNALQVNPDLAEARFLLGKTLLDTGDIAAAEKELRRAADLKYPSDQTAPLLARALVMRGEPNKAIEEFAKVEVASPQNKAELQTALGQAYLATGKLDVARDRFATALVALPDYPPAQLGEASVAAFGGDLPGALALVETALAKSPLLPEGWLLKGDVLLAQGQTDPAIAAYRKALEIRPDYLPAHSLLVSLLMQQGKTDDAGKQLEAMQKVAPKHPQTLYLQALFAFQKKDYVAARDAIQKQLAAMPDNIPGLVLAGRIENRLGSFAQAELHLSMALQRAPRQRVARITLIETFLRTGQSGKALDALKPLLDEGAPTSDVLALAGEVYARSGDSAKAAAFFEKASALDPDSAQKRTAVALSHMAMGDSERGFRELEEAAATDTGVRADLAVIATLVRQRKYDQALTAILALEKKQPESALSHNLRGEVLVAKRDLAGARRSFERALAIDASSFPAAAGLALLDIGEKKPEDAKKRFETLLAKDPKNVNALLAIAGLRARAGGTTDEVGALLGKATAANPGSVEARLALIQYYLGAKEPKKAVAAAQEALLVLPERAEILDALARAQWAAGESNQAIATYTKLAQLMPGSPGPLMAIAEVQVATKDNNAALQTLHRALRIKPDDVDVQRRIVALEVAADRAPAALAAARELQKQRPRESIGYILEGDIYARQKAWSDAIAAYRNGLKRVGTTDLAIRLASALRGGGSEAEAEKFGSTWLKDHPGDRAYRLYLAESAMMKKDFAGAARQYKVMVESDPNDALALNNLAWVSGELKDPKALEYAERAYVLAPRNAGILDTLGTLLLDKGDVKRAVEVLQRAAAAAPDSPSIHLNLARALIKDGQKEAAKKELGALAKLGDRYPNQATVAKMMQGL